MLTKRQKTAVAIIAVLLVAVLVGMNAAMNAIRSRSEAHETANHPTQTTERDDDYDTADGAYMTRDAETMCAQLAPKALAAYVTDSADRDELLQKYFTPNAQGLTVSVKELAKQPSDSFEGFLNTSEGITAVCSVATGIEAPWILSYSWDDANGWRCDAVTGGMIGAYKQHSGKAPKAKEQ